MKISTLVALFAFCSSYKLFNVQFLYQQVMETKSMLYLVTEFAKNGEIFGKQENVSIVKFSPLTSAICQLYLFCPRILFILACNFPFSV